MLASNFIIFFLPGRQILPHEKFLCGNPKPKRIENLFERRMRYALACRAISTRKSSLPKGDRHNRIRGACVRHSTARHLTIRTK